MAILPEIKELYRKYSRDGLEVIGVSFDDDIQAVQAVCRRLDLTWPQVLVPAGGRNRELWQKASGIGSLPRLLLIDRQGMLRADVAGGIGEDPIVTLLKQPIRPAKR